MKKFLLLFLVGVFLLGSISIAYAVSENSVDNSSKKNIENQVENDESNEDKNETGEENNDEETEKKIRGAKPDYNPRSETAREHMSDVAKAVEELVRFSDRTEDPGIGEEVREVARAQGDSEDKANEAIDEAEKRSEFVKFFIGADYKELKKIKQEMQQNENRIRELNRIRNRLENEGEQQELQEQIRVLEEQNKELSDYLNEEASGFSLLGWLFKWVNKY